MFVYFTSPLMSVQWWKPFHWSPRPHCLILPQVAFLPQFPLSLGARSFSIGSQWNSLSQICPSTSTPFPSASVRFDIASSSPQPPKAILEPWYIPYFCLMLVTVSLLCHPPHLGLNLSATEYFTFVSMERSSPARFVIALQILWVTIRLTVVLNRS